MQNFSAELLGLLVLVGGALFAKFSSKGQDKPVEPSTPIEPTFPRSVDVTPQHSPVDVLDDAQFSPVWKPPERAQPYLPALMQAEQDNGIPAGLLARVAHQESRFRPEIINGSLTSSANAVGIMQIVPRWHPNVDPTNPFEAIPYAGRYLRENFDRFGSWELALAAYNWGPTVLSSNQNFESWPQETKDYVTQIIADVSV